MGQMTSRGTHIKHETVNELRSATVRQKPREKQVEAQEAGRTSGTKPALLSSSCFDASEMQRLSSPRHCNKHEGERQRRSQSLRRPQHARGGRLGLYPIDTLQYSPTTSYQVSYHIQ